MEIDLQKRNNVIVFLIGAGIFFWLSISGFFYLVFDVVCKNLLIINEVEPFLNFYLTETLHLIVLTIGIYKSFKWISNWQIECESALRLLRIFIITFILVQILQVIVTYYALEIVVVNYPDELDYYNELIRTGEQGIIASVFDYIRYVVLIILIYKVTAVNRN